MIVKLLTEHYLEFVGLRGGCRDSSESTLVKCQISCRGSSSNSDPHVHSPSLNSLRCAKILSSCGLKPYLRNIYMETGKPIYA